MIRLECLPKFIDDLDSAVHALFTIWLGAYGHTLRMLLLLPAVLVASALSPVFRNFVIAVVVTYMFAEVVHLACGRPQLRGAAWSLWARA